MNGSMISATPRPRAESVRRLHARSWPRPSRLFRPPLRSPLCAPGRREDGVQRQERGGDGPRYQLARLRCGVGGATTTIGYSLSLQRPWAQVRGGQRQPPGAHTLREERIARLTERLTERVEVLSPKHVLLSPISRPCMRSSMAPQTFGEVGRPLSLLPCAWKPARRFLH